MTYSVQTASDMADIPPLIAAFAAARGWTVDGTEITRPGGGRTFVLSAEKRALNTFYSPHRLVIKDKALPDARGLWTSAPQLGGTFNPPQPSAPTKLHLFGNDAPYDEEGAVAPWIAVVIEFGYNHYRHVYIGNMVKFGSYAGGEIISSNYFCQRGYQNYQTEIGMWSAYNRWLFSAGATSTETEGDGAAEGERGPWGRTTGGVNIEHAENPNTWRKFSKYFDDSNNMRNMPADIVFGGIKDGGIASGLLRRGVSDYAGADILIPYTLFVPNAADGDNYRIRPIGFPAGPRAIDMRNIQSEASITVGNRNWRVFGEFQRNPDTTVYKVGGTNVTGSWWLNETSGYIGVAYPETDV